MALGENAGFKSVNETLESYVIIDKYNNGDEWIRGIYPKLKAVKNALSQKRRYYQNAKQETVCKVELSIKHIEDIEGL